MAEAEAAPAVRRRRPPRLDRPRRGAQPRPRPGPLTRRAPSASRRVDGVVGTLLDLVEIDAGWEPAVEAAAGEALAAVVVDGIDAARAAIAALAAGGDDAIGGAVLALGARRARRVRAARR